jgi:hypothetical protein
MNSFIQVYRKLHERLQAEERILGYLIEQEKDVELEVTQTEHI